MARPSAPRIVVWATLATSLCSPGDAFAEGRLVPVQGPPRVVVERDARAEECPDADALSARVAAIRGRAGLGTAAYRVRFSRDGDPFVVSITAEPSGRARTLTSSDATCDTVANAVAVTLALLFDAEPSVTPPPSAPPPSAPTRATPPRRAAPAALPPKKRLAGTLTVAGASLIGVTGPAAFGVSAEAGLVVSKFRAGLGVLWASDVVASLGPGEVREGLVGGTARLCFAPIAGMFRADLCSGIIVAQHSATAEGFTRNDTRHRPWLAVPLQLSGSYWAGHVGVELGLAALVPVHRTDFAIEGLGVSYESAPVGFSGLLGVVFILPL